MFELPQHVRALASYKDIRVVGVHAEYMNLSEAVMRNIDVAIKTFGGMALLDFADGVIKYKEDCAFLDRAAVESATPRPN
jgi:hypothetical protein